jgi:membrane protein YqaA with SNARE-associated domain
MAEDILTALGLYGGTLVVCFIAGLVPLVNAEVFLVGLTMWAVQSPAQLPAIVVLAAVGQMTAKVLLYYAGLGMFELPRGKWRVRIDRARARIDRWKERPYIVYGISSVVGLPPFYLVSLVAGALRINFTLFCVIGLAGRALRFAILVAIVALA